MTLLEIVQDILNDMDSDEVNSIDDTVEAAQVAAIVRSTYYAMITNRNWPHTRKTIALTASGDADYPTHMKLPDNVKELCFVNYNKIKSDETRKRYEPIRYLEPDAFIRRQNALNNDNDNIDVIVDYTGVELLIRNDKAPEYYTSFDDTYMVFDSYDSELETTLQNSKVQAMAYVIPDWTHTDEAYPDLPDEAFIALLEEAKSKASFKLRQFQDVKAEQEASRQQRWLSRRVRRIDNGVKYPNYGRKGGKSYRDPTFKQGR